MNYTICTAVALLATTCAAGAATIDFEALGVSLGDDAEITDASTAGYGVRFRVNGNDMARVAKIGAPRTAFYGPQNGEDNVHGSYENRIGQYFLTDDGAVNSNSLTQLDIMYDAPTKAASGDILDLDYGESYTVSLYGAANAVLDSFNVDGTAPGAGNGKVTRWGFTRNAADVLKISITGHKGNAANFGLGFDNFSYDTFALVIEPEISAVPVPLPAVMLLSGLGMMGAMRRRRKS